MVPQAFLLIFANFIWKRNLQHLERKIYFLSFRQLPKASTMEKMNEINDILHDCREDLEILIGQVQHAIMHMPGHLAAYFEDSPQIRQRHKASHLSPVEHLPELLNRASKLEKLILDDFQILMSSVSVREGHEGMRQTRLATWATVLAAIYLPLTLVTGIFDMNIKGDDGFGSRPAIGAFIGVVVFTIVLALAARWLYKSKHGSRRTRGWLEMPFLTRKWWRKDKNVERDLEAAKDKRML